MAGFALADIFVVRSTGVPFEVLESLATTDVSQAARAILERRAALQTLARTSTDAIDQHAALSFGQRKKLRKRLAAGAAIDSHGVPALEDYERARAAIDDAVRALDEQLATSYEGSTQRIIAAARTHLPAIAVLQLASETLDALLASEHPKHTRSLASWLQRVCSKNDTISRFGPSWWGHVDAAAAGVTIEPEPGIAARVVWVERWVVLGLIEAINADPDVRPELAPRKSPSTPPVDDPLVARCDGLTPAHVLGELDRLAELADQGVLIWKLEAMFVDDLPLPTLAADVARWRDGPVRGRWLAAIDEVVALADECQREIDPARRRDVIERLQAMLGARGVMQRARTGRLYEATNPLVENCSRAGAFVLGTRPIDALLADATPWLELFRDAASVIALSIYDGVHDLVTRAPRTHGRLGLPAFLAFAEANGVNLRGPAIARFAPAAFRDIRKAFARQLADRADAPAWELSPADCRFLAGPRVPQPDLPCPSADLAIVADSCDAVARGDYQWVISELHHHFALMGRAVSWSCPDPARLHAHLRAAHRHQPAAFYDAATSTVQSVHAGTESLIDALGGNVATSYRTKPHWKSFPPWEVEVILDEERRDIRLACRGTDLGSLFPLPRYFFGMHPFFPLQLDPHTPRLYRGRTIFQRRAWVITNEELGGPFGQLSAALVLAVERLRADRDLPRWVFLRVRDDVLSGADATNRMKDVKPICLDLESYVFIEMLARRLRKYGRVELVEMIPAPHQLVWHEADGHRCFEIRTLLVPA